MKKYKHKQTGDIIERTLDGYGYATPKEFLLINVIPSKYIENSNDWEEITDEVVTVDGKGVEVIKGIKTTAIINGWAFTSQEIQAFHTALTCSDPLTADKCEKLLKKMGGKNG